MPEMKTLTTVDGRTYELVDANARKSIDKISNPNLLVNADFRNFVTECDVEEYGYRDTGWSAIGYVWKITKSAKMTKGDGFWTFESDSAIGGWGQIIQRIPCHEQYIGKKLTLSVLYKTKYDTLATGLYDNAGSGFGGINIPPSEQVNLFKQTFTPPSTGDRLAVAITLPTHQLSYGKIDIYAMKLELGDKQTLAHQDADGNWILNDPVPSTGMELAKCVTYSAEPSLPLTNKTLATTEQTLQGAVPYGKELKDSWAELRTRIISGDFTGIHIGDYKTITLTTGEVVVMEVAGIDQYYQCGDPRIGHHIDFISRDCLVNWAKFNETATNNGTETEPNPWRASALFKTMNDEENGVFATLPDDLKPCIIEKHAHLEQRAPSSGPISRSTGRKLGSMGKLWLPTEVEVIGYAMCGDPRHCAGAGCGIQYPIFTGGSKHMRKCRGNGATWPEAWWFASAVDNSATLICAMSYATNASQQASNRESCFPVLCFRIG